MHSRFLLHKHWKGYNDNRVTHTLLTGEKILCVSDTGEGMLWRVFWRLSSMKYGGYRAVLSHTELHRADDGEQSKLQQQPKKLDIHKISELISGQRSSFTLINSKQEQIASNQQQLKHSMGSSGTH